jgi:hypothetical protein
MDLGTYFPEVFSKKRQWLEYAHDTQTKKCISFLLFFFFIFMKQMNLDWRCLASACSHHFKNENLSADRINWGRILLSVFTIFIGNVNIVKIRQLG